jgi:D-lactate dehydrogenase (cytochrome)
MTPETNTSLVDALQRLLGERVTTAEAELSAHGRVESYHPPLAPGIVVYPQTTVEVAAVLALCAAARVPVVPYGAGSSLEGHTVALRGGVCVDMTRMNRIIAVRPDDLDVTVEAGVTRTQLNDVLLAQGYFFPVDPGADATLGGMAATRASGTTTVRYGSMRDNVISLTVVLADGRVVRTASRARKSSAGYDLTRLFIGSEGTLGIITELTLRIFGSPECASVAVCAFPSIDAAVRCVTQVIQVGIPVARAELLDELYVGAVNRRAGLDYAVSPTVLFEFHGSPVSVAGDSAEVEGMARELGATQVRSATAQEDRTRLWRARHEAYYAGLSLRPGCKGFVTDVCVPLSRLAECMAATRSDIQESGLMAPILGHVGDGNFHVSFLLDPDSPSELAEAQGLNQRMVERAIEMGGTCSGEHGVGYGKGKFLRLEHGDGVDVMKAIKVALDPHGILNPGKMTEAATT